MSSYKDYENNYPGYIIIKLEGYFYTAHGRSAELISILTGYKLGMIGGIPITGSPVTHNMSDAMRSVNVSYIIAEGDQIIERNDGIPIDNFNGIHRPDQMRHSYRKYELETSLIDCAQKLHLADEGIKVIQEMLPEGTILMHKSFGQCDSFSIDEDRVYITHNGKVMKFGLLHCIYKELITSELLDHSKLEAYREYVLNRKSLLRQYNRLKSEYDSSK